MNEERDIQLVLQCLKGNAKAFETIVDSYQQPLFNAAYRIVNDFDEAEDITQTAFIKAYEKLSTFNTKQKFFSWLYRIAVNESLNVAQQQKRFVKIDEYVISHHKEAEDHLHETDVQQSVQEAVSKLQQQYKTVIVLKHFQHLSYSEISEILEIPEKTVKSRLFTARNLLREYVLQQRENIHE